jgi:anti-sigma regulatory factor (Ser/Thr protein kinase)
MDDDPYEVLSLVAPARIETISRVRRAVASWLGHQPLHDDDAGTVQVVVSELVANAVEASHEGEEIGVRLARRDGAVSVEVLNPSQRSAPVPIPAMADPMATRGRGLAIVGSLAEQLSLVEEDGNTVARCRVRVPAEASAPEPSR